MVYYKHTNVSSNSGRELKTLLEFGINREYVDEVILPFASRLMSDDSGDLENDQIKRTWPKAVFIKDIAGYNHMRNVLPVLVAENSIDLHTYSLNPKDRYLISSYELVFKEDKLHQIIENKMKTNQSGQKMLISVCYEISLKQADLETKLVANPTSLIVSQLDSDGKLSKAEYYENQNFQLDDIFSRAYMPRTTVYIQTLRN